MHHKKITIYTGTGDNGTTSLIGGKRVSKDHPRVEAYGTIDELNAHLGLLCITIDNEETKRFIEQIEHKMFTIGSSLACEDGKCALSNEDIEAMEKRIDALEATLSPMHEFIIPGGTEAAARANLCRTVCRRAERELVNLQKDYQVAHEIMVYMNRLSDYLFLLQRELLCGKEKMWEKPCK